MILRKIAGFWKKYENISLEIAFVLISLQIIHLYWLSTDVVLQRITGESFFAFPQQVYGKIAIVPFLIVDYLEIPALVAGITFYSLIFYKNRRKTKRDIFFLIFLAVQVFHIFWLTDEMVYEVLFESDIVKIPIYAAWVAIAIDYLEIPVLADLFRRIVRSRK